MKSAVRPLICSSELPVVNTRMLKAVMLPVEACRTDFLEATRRGQVVLTAPTGTGKSTQVPRWLSGKVLVIQPRRVACRAVAGRIAELEGEKLGEGVGYRVRDDDCSSADTRILVVTPGIVLSRAKLLEEFDSVVLDEFHERRLDTDLILALLLEAGTKIVAMSATLDGERLAQHIGGVHLTVSSRNFPVDITYSSAGDEHPSLRGLEGRVLAALKAHEPLVGDVLVFLPGKGEIASLQAALSGGNREVLCLHGGLSLAAQARVLSSGKAPRVILSTNVAETSLTIPGVRLVLDAGLVRRTSYHEGRSYLTMASVALDSAAQRSGRAGRTAPGACVRLWGKRAQLEESTPPEIYRESLVPLLMSAAERKLKPTKLRFLDPPKEYALADAQSHLLSLGAITQEDGLCSLTERGHALRGLPLDPWLSAILVEAAQQQLQSSPVLQDAIDLVAMLEGGQASALAASVAEEELAQLDCDALALLAVIRREKPLGGALGAALREARATRKRLRASFGLKGPAPQDSLDKRGRERLLRLVLTADARCAYVARRRKQRVTFSNGGTEISLARESRVARAEEGRREREAQTEAILVLASHAVARARDKMILATLASPVPLRWLADAELGEVHAVQAQLQKKGPQKGQITVQEERSYAGRVISVRDSVPQGEMAREAVCKLFLAGTISSKNLKRARSNLSRRAFAARLAASSDPGFFAGCTAPPELEPWLLARLLELGLESGEDLALLGPDDLVPDDVPASLAPALDERFPQEVDLGDCLYEATYDLEKKQVLLSIVKGARKKPPPANYLPRFEGLRIFVEAGGSFHQIRR